jgi:hypothetical protein
MQQTIVSKELAAVVLVNLGLATYQDLGVELSDTQAYLVSTGRSIALGLNFRPKEKEAVILKCRQLLGAT